MCRSYKTSNSFLPRSKYSDIVDYLENVCENQSDFIRDAIVYYWEHHFNAKVQDCIDHTALSPKTPAFVKEILSKPTQTLGFNSHDSNEEDMEHLLSGL